MLYMHCNLKGAAKNLLIAEYSTSLTGEGTK